MNDIATCIIANFLLYKHLKPDRNNIERLKNFFDEINETFSYPSQLPEEEKNSIWEDSIEEGKQHKFSQPNYQYGELKDLKKIYRN